MAKTLKDLALALLNATLILVALCLFLAWKTASTVDGLTAAFSQNLIKVTPLRDEVAGLREDLAAMRADLAVIKSQSGEATATAVAGLQQKIQRMESGIQGAQARVRQLVDEPEQLIDYSIQTAADALTHSVSEIRGCQPAS